jgi:hypothetical protein
MAIPEVVPLAQTPSRVKEVDTKTPASPAAPQDVPSGSDPSFNEKYFAATRTTDKPPSLPTVHIVKDIVDEHTTTAMPADIATKMPLIAKQLEMEDAARNPYSGTPLHFTRADIQNAVDLETNLAAAKDDPAAASKIWEAQIESIFAKVTNNDKAIEEDKVDPRRVIQLMNKYGGSQLTYVSDVKTADGKMTNLVAFVASENQSELVSDDPKETVSRNHRVASAVGPEGLGVAEQDVDTRQLHYANDRRIDNYGEPSFVAGKGLAQFREAIKRASFKARNRFQADDPFTQKLLQTLHPKTQPQSGATQE